MKKLLDRFKIWLIVLGILGFSFSVEAFVFEDVQINQALGVQKGGNL